MKALFAAASAVFAIIPGVAIILMGLAIPPGDGHKLVFAGTVEAIGVLCLLLLYLNKSKIKKLSNKSITWTVSGLIIAFVFSLGIYGFIYSHCVVSYGDDVVYFPLWTFGEVAKTINDAGGSRYNAITKLGIDGISEDLRSMPYIHAIETITTVSLLTIYQLIPTTLVIAFGLIGYHQGFDIFENNNVPNEQQSHKSNLEKPSADDKDNSTLA